LFDKEELGKVSMTRNPILTDCMLRVNLVEKIESGISRMKELFPSTEFEISSNWFRVIFKRNKPGVN
jgi:predicted HTH transcriptional regulator